jgi:O-antigen biosynthesis protein WbqP
MYMKIKRLIDIVFSLLGLIVLSPFFLFLIIAIKLDSKGPVLFKQERIGINKTHFYILKFRTMRIDTPIDTPTHLLENPMYYITNMGKFLRKTSLDELPQIWNIFIGQMSIIGPRPALWNQYDLIEERDRYGANNVPPGLTGWAQINGRDELPIEVKAKLDGEYVEKISFLMDVKCFFGTIVSVVKSEGVVEGGTGSTGMNELLLRKRIRIIDWSVEMLISYRNYRSFWKLFSQELINNNYEDQYDVVRETSDTTLIDNSGLNIEKVVGSIDNREFIERQ